MAKTQDIPVKELEFPPRTFYVRDRDASEWPDEDHVQQMIDVATKSAKAGNGWPFPPITVMALPENFEPENEGAKWLVLDGVNRTHAAIAARFRTIPAEVRSFKGETATGEAFLFQLTSNMAHGLRLDTKARDKAIYRLRKEFGLPLARIAEEIGISESSVSRIARGKQGETSGKQHGGARRPAKVSRGQVVKDGFDPIGQFYSPLANLVEAYAQHRTNIIAHVHHIQPSYLQRAHAMVAQLIDPSSVPAEEPDPLTERGE